MTIRTRRARDPFSIVATGIGLLERIAERANKARATPNFFGELTVLLSLLCLSPVCGQSPIDEFAPTVQGGSIRCLAVQPDGKIVMGGYFTHVEGVARPYLVRVHPDGTMDDDFAFSFTKGPLSDAFISFILSQSDGSSIVAGSFIEINGQPRTGLARIKADSTLDSSFNVRLETSGTGTPRVNYMAEQPDGKILLA